MLARRTPAFWEFISRTASVDFYFPRALLGKRYIISSSHFQVTSVLVYTRQRKCPGILLAEISVELYLLFNLLLQSSFKRLFAIDTDFVCNICGKLAKMYT